MILQISNQMFGNPMNNYLYLSIALFVIGALGVIIRRNAIIVLMCIELMLNSTNLILVAFSTNSGNVDGQLFVFFIMVVAAAEVAVGLALFISIYRNTSTIDINILKKLKG
jgi:NADH-quinone oxidoreductase subunit K